MRTISGSRAVHEIMPGRTILEVSVMALVVAALANAVKCEPCTAQGRLARKRRPRTCPNRVTAATRTVSGPGYRLPDRYEGPDRQADQSPETKGLGRLAGCAIPLEGPAPKSPR